MRNIKVSELYVSIDGDDVGKKLAEIIYKSHDEGLISNFSDEVINIFQKVNKWVSNNGGRVLFCAGDSILYKISTSLIDESINEFDKELFTVTVGIGNSIVKAHWALNIAKSMGKNQVLYFHEIEDMYL